MRNRKALVAGVIAGSVALGGLVGALAFAPGLGVAQTDDETEDESSDRWWIGGWCFGDGEGPFAVAADAIGIPHGDLMYAMRGGSTIAEVAESEGVDAAVVIDALVASWREKLDAAVDDGYYSQAVADQIAEGFEERATDLVNGELAIGHHGAPGFGFGRGPWEGHHGEGHGPWGGADPEDEAEATVGS